MLNKLTSQVRRCIEDYNMIEDGETIAVGISGGKDSLALLCALASLRGYYPKKFEIHAVTLEMGFEGMDFSQVAELCKELDVPYTKWESEIACIVFNERKEKNPCSLCSKMRRAALCESITGLGVKKIALAHHYDDAVETFMLSLLYEGRVHCFQPVTHLDRTDVTQLRPMLYVREYMIVKLAEALKLPVVKNTCPMNGVSKREDIKTLIKTLGKEHPDIRSKIFGAMQRLPLDAWEVQRERHPATGGTQSRNMDL